METLADDLPRQMTYVRDIVIPVYQGIGPGGGFAIAMMRRDLDRAQTAMIEGDAVAMIDAYRALKEYKL